MSGLLLGLWMLASLLQGRQFVRIDPEMWATRESAQPDRLAAGEHLWTWSASCAPAMTLESTSALPCAPIAPRELIVKDARRHLARGVRVVWATKQMNSEIPEELLPFSETDERGMAIIAAPRGAAAFVRVAGTGLASNWTELRREGTTVIVASAAAETAIAAVGENGHGARRVRALFVPADAPPAAKGMCIAVTADEGNVRALLPRGGLYRGVFWSESCAPAERTATAAMFGRSIVLPDGAALHGTVVDVAARPVASANVEVAFLLPGGQGWKRRSVTAPDGTFQLHGVGSGVTVLSVVKSSFASLRRDLTLLTGARDLGRLELPPARSLRLRVVDAAAGTAVPHARVRSTNGQVAETAGDGFAVLQGLGTGDEIPLTVQASDYLEASARVPLLSKAPPVVRLERGASISARVVSRETGAPLGPGNVMIALAGSRTTRDFDSSGDLHLGALRDGTLDLEIRVPGYESYSLAPRQLGPGESVNLGKVMLDRGVAISGTVIDALTREPVASASIRIPRPTLSGARLSYVMNDWMQTTTSETGRFRLTGLRSGEYRLLVNAGGRAPLLTERLHVGDGDADAGELEISNAHDVRIQCTPARRCGSRAELLLGDANDDWASLEGSLNEGRGEIHGAPDGVHTLRLSREGATVAEREIEISRDQPAAVITIQLQEIAVRGDVVRQGRPVRGGSVQFVGRAASGGVPIVVEQRIGSTPVQTRTFGAVPATALVPVDTNGTFTTTELAPGEYRVSYSGELGESPEQVVFIPEAATYDLHLQLAATALSGTIVDEQGKVPEWVRVEVRGPSGVISTDAGSDGRFHIDSPPAGHVAVRAYNDSAEASREVVIDEGRAQEADLVLHPRPQARLRVQVAAAEGSPFPNASVFVLCDGALKSATTDFTGMAEISLPASSATCSTAAFAPAAGWAFAEPLSIMSGAADVPVAVVRFSSTAASIVVESGVTAAVSVLAPTGFPLDRLFALVGWPSGVAPGRPLRLHGMPPGTYAVVVRSVGQRTVSLDGTRDAHVSF
jgi:hypothetical protein